MGEAIYFNSLTGKRSKYGIRISGKAEDVIDEIRKHANAKGYINLELKELRQEGKYGKTHYLVVDTYQRDQQTEQAAPSPPASQEGWGTKPSAPADETDDLPF
jgi:hypothetical protein